MPNKNIKVVFIQIINPRKPPTYQEETKHNNLYSIDDPEINETKFPSDGIYLTEGKFAFDRTYTVAEFDQIRPTILPI